MLLGTRGRVAVIICMSVILYLLYTSSPKLIDQSQLKTQDIEAQPRILTSEQKYDEGLKIESHEEMEISQNDYLMENSLEEIDIENYQQDDNSKTEKENNHNKHKSQYDEYYSKITNRTVPDLVRLNMDDPSIPRENEDKVAYEELQTGLIPSIIHFVWCGKRWFEFKHYMSILSVIRLIKPNKIAFYYDELPVMDRLYYNQWLDYLQHDFPYLYLIPLSEEQLTICNGRTERLDALIRLLSLEGGLYISEDTWLINFDIQQRKLDVDWSLNVENLSGYLMMKPNLINADDSQLEEKIFSDMKLKKISFRRKECAHLQHLILTEEKPECLHVTGMNFSKIFPIDIWERTDSFGRIARKIFYGTEEILKPKPDYTELVPNIGHMIWIGGGNINYVFYLSVLSMLYVVKVDILFIHGDKEPEGQNWMEIKRTQPRVKFITRPEPTMVYQSPIEPYFRALMSDIIRVDLMIKYGGIYCDTDAIWVKPLTEEERAYDATAAYDWIDWSYPYPDSVNFGVSYGKKNADFWRVFRDSMRVLHNRTPGFTGVMNPYKILERRPELLRIDKRLSVICYQLKCHPLWVDNYHNETNNHVTTNSIKDWKNDVHAFHWTFPNPEEYRDRATLLNSTGLFAEIGKHVLEKAGLYNPSKS